MINHHPRHIQPRGGISQISHHNPNSHCDPRNPTAKYLLRGYLRFTFSSSALCLGLTCCADSHSLHFHTEQFTAEETRTSGAALSPAWAGCPDAATKGEQEQLPGGQMVLWGELGLTGDSEQKRGATAWKQIYSWARQLGKLKFYHREIPARLLT